MIPSHESVLNDGLIMALWKLGLNTLDIAKRFHVHESVVAKRLATLRDGRTT